MKAVLIRHGETEHNRDDTITGQMDVDLNQYGRIQAEKAAERLKKRDFSAAYSSDLQRTFETVNIIAGKHEIHPEPCKEFRERNYGIYEGKHKNNWRETIENHDGDTKKLKPEDGESMKEVGERFVGKLDELRKIHDADEEVLIGGHSVAIRASILEILDLEGKYFSRLSQDNTGLTELEYSGEWGWKILTMNDSAHLE